MSIPSTLLVPTDLSDEDAAVLDHAVEKARSLGARVHLLHVFDSLLHDLPPEAVESESTRALRVRLRTVARDALQHLAAAHAGDGVRLTVEQRLAPDPAPSILACARDIGADLIVMGTHGRRGVQRLLHGSVAEAVAARAPCPVDIVPLTVEAVPWTGVLEAVRERIQLAWM